MPLAQRPTKQAKGKAHEPSPITINCVAHIPTLGGHSRLLQRCLPAVQWTGLYPHLHQVIQEWEEWDLPFQVRKTTWTDTIITVSPLPGFSVMDQVINSNLHVKANHRCASPMQRALPACPVSKHRIASLIQTHRQSPIPMRAKGAVLTCLHGSRSRSSHFPVL